jgi:LytS/YehU family sensor histidine kinase
MAENVDNTLLLSVLKEIRSEQNKHRELLLQTVDYMRKMGQRLDGRIVAIRDDLELMLKSELMGRLAHFETKIENLLSERTDSIEKAD